MFSRPFALSAVIAVLVTFAGVAGASERLGWEDLAPPFDGTADPLYRLADDVQADFYDLMWARSLVADMKTLKKTHSSIRAVGASAQNLKAKLEATEAEARANLEAAGFDIAALSASDLAGCSKPTMSAPGVSSSIHIVDPSIATLRNPCPCWCAASSRSAP